MSPGTQSALQSIQNRANAQAGDLTNMQNTLSNQFNNPIVHKDGRGMDHLRGVLDNKDYVNPHIRDALQYAIGDVSAQNKLAFSRSGRYGSGAHQGALAREVGRLSAETLGAAAERERDRRIGVAGALEQLNQGGERIDLAGRGQQLQTGGAIANMGNEAIRNNLYALQAAQTGENYQQRAYDNNFQNQMNQYMLPQQALSNYHNVIGNIASTFGQQTSEGESKTTQTTKQTPSLFDSLSRLATGAFGAYNAFGGFGGFGAGGGINPMAATNFNQLMPRYGFNYGQQYNPFAGMSPVG